MIGPPLRGWFSPIAIEQSVLYGAVSALDVEYVRADVADGMLKALKEIRADDEACRKGKEWPDDRGRLPFMLRGFVDHAIAKAEGKEHE